VRDNPDFDDPEEYPNCDDPYHPGAQWCVRSLPSRGGHGQQCCYDQHGELINGGTGAGTPDRASPENPLEHWLEDVAPYHICRDADCLLLYLKVRPPNRGRDGKGNECPINIVIWGDGHTGPCAPCPFQSVPL
jgi:hypothetical protein